MDAKAAHLIAVWRQACHNVNTMQSGRYDKALEYRDAVAHEALGALCASMGICDENGDDMQQAAIEG